MTRRLDPGPPLTAGDEYCPDEAPTGAEYMKASAVAVLLATGGAAAWFLLAMATHRLWGFISVLVGVGIGLAVHRAAGRHRSSSLGGIAAGGTLLAACIGYGLLWLPFVSPDLDRSLTWEQLGTVPVGLFIAFLMAGPRPASKDH